MKMPQVQFLDRVLDAPVVTQRQAPQVRVRERISPVVEAHPVVEYAKPAPEAPLMFVTTPVVEALPVVEYVKPATVVEHVAPVPAVTYEDEVEDVQPAHEVCHSGASSHLHGTCSRGCKP